MEHSRQVRPKVEKGPRPALSFTARRSGKPPLHLADLDMVARKDAASSFGYPAFRASQLSTHYFQHACVEAEKMPDLPAGQRAEMVQKFFPPLLRPLRTLQADAGKTQKTLWQLFDGAVVESVLMKYPNRSTLCISSQAGCGMACPFCATGQGGLMRNLSTAEIVEQLRLNMEIARSGALGAPERISNVVFMGMGEPLSNYKSVIQALHRLIEPPPAGFGISARNITLSTVGIVPGIERLAQENLPVTLAISLHAPDDELRDDLIPINSHYKVGELLDAARAYFRKTGRRVSIEYALIKDMNDHKWRAELLAHELNKRGKGWAHINPIPLNPTPGSIWTASTPAAQKIFVNTLRQAGISTTIRDTRGSDIDGACGQLAAEIVDPAHIARKAARAQQAVDSRIAQHREAPENLYSILHKES